MSWITDIGSLPAAIAVAVVLTLCVTWVLRIVARQIVEPFKVLISNHLEHDKQDREAHCEAMKEVAEELKAQSKALSAFVEEVKR